MGDKNTTILKQLSQGKDPRESSAYSFKIPGSEKLTKAIKNTKPKLVVDVVLFAAGIFLMYKFGKIVAEELDNQMPTEKSMMEMMKSMQPQGMPPMQ